ncbi:hypothetical protein ACFLZW_07445 [Chloroflexota bacterium]
MPEDYLETSNDNIITTQSINSSNAPNLFQSLEFLEKVIEARMKFEFQDLVAGLKSNDVDELPQLEYYDDDSAFGNFITKIKPTFPEYIILLLSLAPHVRPEFLDKVIKDALPNSGDFPQIGGMRDSDNRGFLPTAETALFLPAMT